MRACATANAVFLGLSLGAFAFAACSSSPAPSPPPAAFDSTASPPSAAASAPVNATANASATASANANATGVNAAMPAPGPPRSDITNEPDGGVVLNNAMTAADAGSSDRLQPLIDLVKTNRDGFRRCFDARNDKAAGGGGRVVLFIEVRPEGTIEKIEIDTATSTYNAPDVGACMVAFAKTLVYPKSPSGKFTRFTYPFDFKAR